MRMSARLAVAVTLAAVLAAIPLVPTPPSALASAGQLAMIEDDPHLDTNATKTLQAFRQLGAGIVRVFVRWTAIAPGPGSSRRPAGFRASDPAAYPKASWAYLDAIVSQARADGIAVDLLVAGGAPRWAERGGIPGSAAGNLNRAWYPSAGEYGAFVRALATRYRGSYRPSGFSDALPRVSFWEIWNEPNFGEDLGPQATNGSSVSVAPGMYRGLVDAAWSALAQTGHRRDTVVIGQLSARGVQGPPDRSHPQGLPGNFGQTKPLQFIRTLYCVDSSFRQLRGAAAAARGCPATAAGSRRFRSQHPGLFGASGFGIHPYPGALPPTADGRSDPDFAAFSELPRLERELDRLQRIYGLGTRFAIYNNEYGYITNPPNRSDYASPATAGYYLNWAEYLSWRSPRIVTTMQYLLNDPVPDRGTPEYGGFASGLLSPRGTPKADYYAYRMPLYLPVTSTRRRRSLEVWGAARPAGYAALDTHARQVAQLQFQPHSRGPFTVLKKLTITDPRGYFDVHIAFPSSGTVRLMYAFPASERPAVPGGSTIYSRGVLLTIH
jgi:hypothetical protein